MSVSRTTLLIVAGGALLSGCQAFGSKTARLNAEIRVPMQTRGPDQVQSLMADGRSALAARNYAGAIAVLREAALEPEHSAEAYNGLGVAYAGIGRNDLAERYFKLATEIAPTDQRYADNLIRFYRARLAAEMRRRERMEAQELAAVEAEQRVRTFAQGLRSKGPERGLIRVSQAEVVIRSTPLPSTAPAAIVEVVQVAPAAPIEAATKQVAIAEQPQMPVLKTAASPATQVEKPKPEFTEPAPAVAKPQTVVNRHALAAASPVRAVITTTGRRYEPAASPGITVGQSTENRFAVLTTSGRLDPLPTMAETLVGTRAAPQPIIAVGKAEPGRTKLALADLDEARGNSANQ